MARKKLWRVLRFVASEPHRAEKNGPQDRSREPFCTSKANLLVSLTPRIACTRGICQWISGLNNTEFFLPDLVVAAVFDDLVRHILGDVHEGDPVLDADLANGVARDVGVKGDLSHDVARAYVIGLALVDLQ